MAAVAVGCAEKPRDGRIPAREEVTESWWSPRVAMSLGVVAAHKQTGSRRMQNVLGSNLRAEGIGYWQSVGRKTESAAMWNFLHRTSRSISSRLSW